MKACLRFLPLFVLAGTLSAAEVLDPAAPAAPGKLPGGWNAYITGPKETRAASGAVAVKTVDGKKALLIEDKSDRHEYGIGKVVPCKPGEYFRITASYRPANGAAIDGVELTAYFVPEQKFRAGAVRPDSRGVAVLDTVKAPAGTRAMRIYLYTLRPAKTALLLDSLKIESSAQPFPEVPLPEKALVPGRTYYFSPDGKDDAAGTRGAPFRTIDKANKVLAPGDTAIFLPGKYSGTIRPQRAGAPDAPIVYRAEQKGTAILNGPVGGYAAEIRHLSHIELDGFRFEAQTGSRWLVVAGSRFCTFRNLHMRDCDLHNPIHCRDSSYLRFSDIVAAGCRNVGSNGILSGDMWNNFNVTHSVYERMYISQVGHRPFGLWYDCENIVVRDTVFDCRWGRNFEFFSPKKLLMERCVVTNAFEGSGSMDGAAKLFTDNSIVRYNLVLRNGYHPVGTGGYQYADMPRFTTLNSRFYFNTFYRNEDSAWAATGDNVDLSKTCYRNNIIKNNVFSENNFDRGTAFGTGVAAYTDCRVRHNLFWGGRPGAKTVYFWPGRGRDIIHLTPAEAEKQAKPYFEDNLEGDPKFTDADRDDFTPADGSPALDGGEHLTVTTAAGKNTTFLPVADCRYFYDGFRIPGEKGDMIVIGPQKTLARIVHISVWQNTITLDRRVSFEKGDTVDLPYAGKAPDLGAYEAGMKRPTGPVFDSAQIRLQSDPDILLVSDFEANDPDNWFHLWNISRSAQSYGFLDKTTAATGTQSWRIEYVPYETLRNWTMLSPAVKDLDSLLTTHLSPAWWRIADHPMLRFAYRVPKGVPMCVTLYCGSRRAAPGPASVVVAQTPAVKVSEGYVQKPLIALTDDDAWHTAEIDLRKLTQEMPELRYVYKLRFWAGGNAGKPGMRYWLDDVSIKAK